MARRARPLAAAAALLGAALLLVAAGCGEKIAIPLPEGDYVLRTYAPFQTLDDADARQVIQVGGARFVLNDDALVKRDLYFAELGRAAGLSGVQALCWSEKLGAICVVEDLGRTLRLFTTDLQELGAAPLAEPQAVAAMAASARGADQVPEALTFLYLADPAAGVVWRYAVDQFLNVVPYGLLTRSDGTSLRYARQPAGLVRDAEDHVLVCDVDSVRHWVIRFDPTPDETDEDRRGVAAVYAPYEICAPPAAAEYALGNAPRCNQTDWVAGPLDTTGVFDTPLAAAVDGAGRIYVADSGNNRFQIFGLDDRLVFGHLQSFGDALTMPRPVSIATWDYRYNATTWYYGALVFVVAPDLGQVRSYVSQEYDSYLNQQPRPPE